MKSTRSQSALPLFVDQSISPAGLGLTLKKLERRAMQQKTNERMAFQRRISLGDFDNRNVLVLDESSVGKNMSHRLRGYGPKGHRVRWYDYFGKSHKGTLMAACNSDGFVLRACEFIPETMDTERFVRWVNEGLVQTGVIGNYVCGEKNSVDNVNQQHDPRIRNLIENAGGILICLPRYSRDMSPIELGFSVFKRNLQSDPVAENDDAAFKTLIFKSLASCDPTAARNSFNHCGFNVPPIELPNANDVAALVIMVMLLGGWVTI